MAKPFWQQVAENLIPTGKKNMHRGAGTEQEYEDLINAVSEDKDPSEEKKKNKKPLQTATAIRG